MDAAIVEFISNIEDVILENMIIKNYIDFFEIIDKNKDKNNLISVKK